MHAKGCMGHTRPSAIYLKTSSNIPKQTLTVLVGDDSLYHPAFFIAKQFFTGYKFERCHITWGIDAGMHSMIKISLAKNINIIP